jgi:hypothetical protein
MVVPCGTNLVTSILGTEFRDAEKSESGWGMGKIGTPRVTKVIPDRTGPLGRLC